MDLKIKDVAELLNVSETTIRRWLTDGKIPAYKINHQYRFSRIEIENWMMQCKLKSPDDAASALNPKQIYPPVQEETASRGMQQFCLYRAINQGNVFSNIPGTTKEELIRGTTRAIAQTLNVDAEVLAELLIDRERMMPTALNNGIAVPHTRDFLRKGPLDMVFVVYPKQPIEYGALDGMPVHALFFLFASNDKGHLQLLAKMAHFSSNEQALEFLAQKPDKKQLLDFVRGWEGQVRTPT
ncbi:MAG: PTS sugar transporter subunit IIA [Candidatus Melainabacteria bacterium]|nr:PTS sugar transporter subunit IIA [Candidatus Melainabacteria bacterium]